MYYYVPGDSVDFMGFAYWISSSDSIKPRVNRRFLFLNILDAIKCSCHSHCDFLHSVNLGNYQFLLHG